MSTITIEDVVTFPDGSTNPVSVSVTVDGCTIKYLDTSTALSWDNTADVEYLSGVFADSYVRTFKVIVTLITKAVQLREAL